MGKPEEHQRIRDDLGNLVSFEQVYDAYFQRIFHYILHRVVDVVEAEELTSQTFFKALSALWRYRWSGVPIGAWLYRIATNEVNNLKRQKARGKFSSIDDEERLCARFGLPHEELAEAQREVARHKLFLELHQCIEKLKPEDQSLVALRYFEQKSFAEIAQILGKRVGAVTMKTHRALQKLQALLREKGFDDEAFRGTFDESPETQIAVGIVQTRFAE